GIPFLLFQCHGVRLNERVHLDARGRLRRRWKGFSRWDVDCIAREMSLLRRADAVVSIGPNPSAALARAPYRWALGRRPVVQIPNGVDETRFHPGPAAGRAWRAAWGLPEDAPVVLTVSRLVGHKGTDQAIQAFARWSKGRPQARHVIVGDGPERPHLEQQARRLGIAGQVLFTGALPDAQLPAAYQGADAFLFLPTGTEGHPLNMLEALGCGLPVVAPPHAIDATHPEARMFAAPPLDTAAVAKAITAALAAPRPRGTACQLPPHLTLQGCAAAYERLLARGLSRA
ncbi:MAG TPA: glycosyltransferase, partial [Candidatus Thermoplasmatota archaeon]|nr:glycosyltransferase [Candidatus Thermoplasmatota archaeon]